MHRLAVRRSSSRSKYYHYFPPLRYPRLSSLPSTSPPLSGPRNLPPSSLLSLTPLLSFSHVRMCARAFGLFSCFYAPLVFSLPKYNWRCDAPVSLSLSTPPGPPRSPPPSLARSTRGRPCGLARSLAPRVRLRRILDACRQLANSRLPQTGSANRPISRREACSLTLKAASRVSDCNIVVRESIIIKPLRYIFLESE